MFRNRKAVIFLGILLVAGGMCVAGLSRKTEGGQSAMELFKKDTSNAAQTKDFNNSLTNSGQFNTSELFYRMIAAVVVVAILGIGVVLFIKKALPKIAKLPARNIKIIETASLGQHRNIHLVEVSGRKLLIGSTSQAITRLADMSEPLEID